MWSNKMTTQTRLELTRVGDRAVANFERTLQDAFRFQQEQHTHRSGEVVLQAVKVRRVGSEGRIWRIMKGWAVEGGGDHRGSTRDRRRICKGSLHRHVDDRSNLTGQTAAQLGVRSYTPLSTTLHQRISSMSSSGSVFRTAILFGGDKVGRLKAVIDHEKWRRPRDHFRTAVTLVTPTTIRSTISTIDGLAKACHTHFALIVDGDLFRAAKRAKC